jgi:tRNA A37 methylthiotransferase MiaB
MLLLLQVREIWLSSEDTGAYGRDIGASLPALLRALVQVLPPGGWHAAAPRPLPRPRAA